MCDYVNECVRVGTVLMCTVQVYVNVGFYECVYVCVSALRCGCVTGGR